MKIHIIRDQATPGQISEMLEELETYTNWPSTLSGTSSQEEANIMLIAKRSWSRMEAVRMTSGAPIGIPGSRKRNS